jgi:transcriptional regulator with XRE-family HTH domain
MEAARIRRFLGLTQQDVSTATGITVSRLSAAERGIADLNPTEEAVLEAFLGRRLCILLGADHQVRGGKRASDIVPKVADAKVAFDKGLISHMQFAPGRERNSRCSRPTEDRSR